MAEWLYEAGIGEDRAALIEGGEIVEMLIARHDTLLRAGAVLPARLAQRLLHGDRAIFEITGNDAGEAVGRIPAGITEGAPLHVVVVREAIPEAGNPKPPVVRAAEPHEAPSPGPSLLERLQASPDPVREIQPHQPDQLEAFGWSERLAEADAGLKPFTGGLLRISLTPAMTLLDIDGGLAPADLMPAGAFAAAGAIRLFGIGGSIGIDLPMPQAAGKPLRLAAAARIDAILPQPFERTAVNGFGFIQIVRPRIRPSILELIQSDRIAATALALLRRAERAAGRGAITLTAAPAVIGRIAGTPEWRQDLMRRRGAAVHLSERRDAAISSFHVEAEHP